MAKEGSVIKLFLEREIIDPETDMHYACISTVKAVTEVHTHEFFEFFLVTKGSIYHIVNGQRMVLHAGALVLIRKW